LVLFLYCMCFLFGFKSWFVRRRLRLVSLPFVCFANTLPFYPQYLFSIGVGLFVLHKKWSCWIYLYRHLLWNLPLRLWIFKGITIPKALSLVIHLRSCVKQNLHLIGFYRHTNHRLWNFWAEESEQKKSENVFFIILDLIYMNQILFISEIRG
jgi:hypothetical protein